MINGLQGLGLYKNTKSVGEISYYLPWTPADLNTTLWFDAADTDSMTLVDNRISVWNSKGGAAISATQGTANNRPPYGVNTLNGINVASIRASSVGMITEYYVNTPYSITLVSRSAGNGRTLQSRDTNALIDPPRGFYVNGWMAQGIVTANIWTITTLQIPGSSTSQVWWNSTNYGSGTHGNWSRFAIGTSGQYNENPNSDIAEIVVTNTTLTNENREKLEGYLAHKWGLVSTLTASHPYKKDPPAIGKPGYSFLQHPGFQPKSYNPNIFLAGCTLYLKVDNDKSYNEGNATWVDLAQDLTFTPSGGILPLSTIEGVKGFDFNGSGYWVHSLTPNLVDLGSDFTLILVWYAEALPVRKTIFEKAGTSYNSYEQELAMTWETTSVYSYYSRRADYDVSSNNPLPNGWNVVAIKVTNGRTSAARKGYYSLNGAPWVENYTSRSSTALISSGEIRIGTGYAGTVDRGALNAVVCYNRLLSDEEIATSYEMLNPLQ